MFFRITLQQDIYLHPRHFDQHLRETLHDKLNQEVEGKCNGRYGWICTVMSVESIGQGVVQEGTGYVVFPVSYKAIVFRPFKNEVLDTIVFEVNKLGLMTFAGPLSIFVHSKQMQSDLEFDSRGNEPAWVSPDETTRIVVGDSIRVRILGSRLDTTDIAATATISDAHSYLGVISDDQFKIESDNEMDSDNEIDNSGNEFESNHVGTGGLEQDNDELEGGYDGNDVFDGSGGDGGDNGNDGRQWEDDMELDKENE